MSSINNVVLSGRLTKDVEVRMSQNNKKYCQFTLAVDKYVNGEQQADFINCIAWEKTTEILSLYTSKGSKVNVVGRIQTRNYKNNNGQTVYITEVLVQQVELLERKKEEKQQDSIYINPVDDGGYTMHVDSEDLPF